jgi:hypothetical protein
MDAGSGRKRPLCVDVVRDLQGFLNLARSRQSMGSSKINRYSFPFKFEPCATATQEEGVWHVHSDVTPETDPLKWYGVLVPKALRLCQTNFVKGSLCFLRVSRCIERAGPL